MIYDCNRIKHLVSRNFVHKYNNKADFYLLFSRKTYDINIKIVKYIKINVFFYKKYVILQ